MKLKLFFIPVFFLSLVFFSCETTDPYWDDHAPQQQQPAQTAPKPAAAQPAAPAQPVSTEYARSVAALDTAVSEATFNQDRDAIMKTIAELETIMATQDVVQWRRYLSPSSVAYLKNQQNMKTVSARLPGNLTVRTDEDYFKYVFVPSRQGRKIEEIRYVSSTVTKAVQVRQNDDVIYYYFEKMNGRWLVKLDDLQN
jgi:hypothetical protein